MIILQPIMWQLSIALLPVKFMSVCPGSDPPRRVPHVARMEQPFLVRPEVEIAIVLPRTAFWKGLSESGMSVLLLLLLLLLV